MRCTDSFSDAILDGRELSHSNLFGSVVATNGSRHSDEERCDANVIPSIRIVLSVEILSKTISTKNYPKDNFHRQFSSLKDTCRLPINLKKITYFEK